MKNLLLPCFVLLLFSCAEEEESVCDSSPIFKELIQSEVRYNSFKISGAVSVSKCNTNVIEKGIVYSKNDLPTISDTKIKFSDATFNTTVSNLDTATRYYVRPFLVNDEGEFYGEQLAVSTYSSKIEMSDVSAEVSISNASISAKYNFLEGNGMTVLSKGVIFNGVQKADTSSPENQININLENLSPNTTYTYKIFVRTSDKQTNSIDYSFKTQTSNATISKVVVTNASYIGADFSTTYSKTYTDEEITTDKGILISENTNFENSKSYSATTEEGVIKKSISNLNPNTAYYAKAYVENVYGRNYGPVQEFTTKNSGYHYNEIVISDISFTGAKLMVNFTQVEQPELTVEEKGFWVSSSNNFDNYSTHILNSPGTSIEIVLSELPINSTYFVKAFVSNEYGTYYSELSSFTTTALSYTFQSITSSNISFESASANSSFSLDYGTGIETLEKGFEIASTSDFTNATAYTDSSVDRSIAYNFTNLTYDTTYYIRSYVTNSYDKFYGETAQFTTQDSGYNFNTVNYTALSYSSVSINANYTHINSGVVDTIEKGIYFSNSSTGLSNNPILSDDTDQISTTINSLSHNTTYYYQAFVTNTYGTFTSQVFTVSTLNAKPVFDYSLVNSKIFIDNVTPTITVQPKPNTSITSLRIEYTKEDSGVKKYIDYLSEVDGEYTGGEVDLNINGLLPSNLYSVKMILQNNHGTFASSTYKFTTKSDAPTMSLNYEKTADNQVTLTGTLSPAVGDTSISRVYLEYKNYEQSSYTSIELDKNTTEINQVVDDLIQGPQYTFRLKVENQWHTFEKNTYHALPVTYEIGDELFGGIIVHIDNSGYHGIVAAKTNYWVKRAWSTDNSRIELLYSNYDYGKENSETIYNHYKNSDESAPALDYCYGLTVNGYNDWFLGSRIEMIKVMQFCYTTGNFDGKARNFLYNEFEAVWNSNNKIHTNTEENSSLLRYASVTYFFNYLIDSNIRDISTDSRLNENSVVPIRLF